MKKFYFLRVITIMILFVTTISSCKKEDTLYTGKVEITFSNHPNDLFVNILDMGNNNVAIFSYLKPNENGVLIQELNIGNYIIAPFSNSFLYGNSGFQIQAGKTTIIFYNGSIPNIE